MTDRPKQYLITGKGRVWSEWLTYDEAAYYSQLGYEVVQIR